MLGRLVRASLRRGSPNLSRPVTAAAPMPARVPRLRYALVPLALAGAAAAFALRPRAEADAAHVKQGIAAVPTSDLVRSYLVYTACGFPQLVDAAPTLLNALTHSPIPGLKGATEAVIRRTFFAQFVAGEDLPETLRNVAALHNKGIGALLNYGAEAVPGQSKQDMRKMHAATLRQVEMAIDALGDYEDELRRTGHPTGSSQFALKVSGLVDMDVLERASSTLCRARLASVPSTPKSVPFPGLPADADAAVIAPNTTRSSAVIPTAGIVAGEPPSLLPSDANVSDADMVVLHELWGQLRSVSARARNRGVKLLIDAEHAVTQPALDAMTHLLSMVFNRPTPGERYPGPTIFGTYQSYLRRAGELVDFAIQHAEENGYALGVKLVRGAYCDGERAKWRLEGRGEDPIWPNKPATDAAYNESLSKLLTTLSRQLAGPRPDIALSVVAGTHNPESVERFLDGLQATGLAEEADGRLKLRPDVQGKVFIAQLYGMRDDLADRIAKKLDSGGLPVALKYIAYAPMDEVMPFLARRAIENKAIMSGEGGAAVEKKRVKDELWRRFTGAPIA